MECPTGLFRCQDWIHSYAIISDLDSIHAAKWSLLPELADPGIDSSWNSELHFTASVRWSLVVFWLRLNLRPFIDLVLLHRQKPCPSYAAILANTKVDRRDNLPFSNEHQYNKHCNKLQSSWKHHSSDRSDHPSARSFQQHSDIKQDRCLKQHYKQSDCQQSDYQQSDCQ